MTTMYPVKEGDVVMVPPCTQRINLNAASGAWPQAAGVYCIYANTAILGKVTEQNYGANRAYQYTSRIEKSTGKQYGAWGNR
eukprot:NODE_7588_length_448_cov_58.358396_g6750_i0.p2 GENE.NODE_7588_length_448_cov_58.358396_g6750_i0~~NODE_7588_length_448_cov_58.358396_g6750_i0.p2  ORF type:complete len:82 (+),score=28.28 NODE_7588_length_448_cov_58.358396_g6750_i0:84-329(+)